MLANTVANRKPFLVPAQGRVVPQQLFLLFHAFFFP